MKYPDAILIYLGLAVQVFYNAFYDDILFIYDVPTIKKADSQHSLHQNDEDPLVEQEGQQPEGERKRCPQNKTASSFQNQNHQGKTYCHFRQIWGEIWKADSEV